MFSTAALVLALVAAPPWDPLQPVEDEIAGQRARIQELEARL